MGLLSKTIFHPKSAHINIRAQTFYIFFTYSANRLVHLTIDKSSTEIEAVRKQLFEGNINVKEVCIQQIFPYTINNF